MTKADLVRMIQEELQSEKLDPARNAKLRFIAEINGEFRLQVEQLLIQINKGVISEAEAAMALVNLDSTARDKLLSFTPSHSFFYHSYEALLWDLSERTKRLRDNPTAEDAEMQREYIAALCEGLYQMEKTSGLFKAEKRTRMRAFSLPLSKRGLKLLQDAIRPEILRLMRGYSENLAGEDSRFEDAKILHHIKKDIEAILDETDQST